MDYPLTQCLLTPLPAVKQLSAEDLRKELMEQLDEIPLNRLAQTQRSNFLQVRQDGELCSARLPLCVSLKQ